MVNHGSQFRGIHQISCTIENAKAHLGRTSASMQSLAKCV